VLRLASLDDREDRCGCGEWSLSQANRRDCKTSDVVAVSITSAARNEEGSFKSWSIVEHELAGSIKKM